MYHNVYPNLTISQKPIFELIYKNTTTKQLGNFQKNDVPEKIICFVIRHEFQMLRVSWKPRSNGFKPFDSDVCFEEMANEYPSMLIKFLQKNLFKEDDEKEIFEERLLEKKQEQLRNYNFEILDMKPFLITLNLLPTQESKKNESIKKEEQTLKSLDGEELVWVGCPTLQEIQQQ